MTGHFSCELHPSLKGINTHIILSEDDLKFLNKLIIRKRNIELDLLNNEERKNALKIFDRINSELRVIEERNGQYYLSDEGLALFDEIKRIKDVSQFYEIHPYIRPAVTVDGLIFYSGKIVLIERRFDPFKGMMALPGGYVNYNEMVENAFLREMREEIGRDVINSRLFTVVSEPGRDPRGHTISIVFSGDIEDSPVAGDDASKVFLFSVEEAIKMKLAFDHQSIIKKYIERKDDC